MNLKRKINSLIDALIKFLRVLHFRKKVRGFKKKNNKLFLCPDPAEEKKHIRLWRKLLPNVDPHWFRFYSNSSGIIDHRYVPEDVFYSVIERKLNDHNVSKIFSDKNYYDYFYRDFEFPKTILRKTHGIFMDENYKVLDQSESNKIVTSSNKFIVKPSIDSDGGKNVRFYKKVESIQSIDQFYKNNYIVQEKIKQHSFFRKFNPSSLNTLRVFTYRPQGSKKPKILKTVFRMGVSKSIVDNQSSGGISCLVLDSGLLADYAVNKFGKKFNKHPTSNVIFANNKVSRKLLQSVHENVVLIASVIPSQRILSFDITVSDKNKTVFLEVNTCGVEINFLQTNGGSLFGDYTSEVIQHCVSREENDFYYFRYKN